MKIFKRTLFIFFTLSVICVAQNECPNNTNPMLQTRDINNVVHQVECLDQNTGKMILPGTITSAVPYSMRDAASYKNIQAAINSCPSSPSMCFVIIGPLVSDTTAVENLTIPANVGLFDTRPMPSLGDGISFHLGTGGNSANHGYEIQARGGSNPGGEGPTFDAVNDNSLTNCGASTCSVDMTASYCLSFGSADGSLAGGRLYTLCNHGGWWDGTAWHPDPDWMTNSGKTGSAQPGKSRMRLGATGAIIFNPEVTSVTSQLDPEIAETNNYLAIWNDQVGVGGANLFNVGRNINWSTKPLKVGGTFANTPTDAPTTGIDVNVGVANASVFIGRDSNGASGITHNMFTDSSANGGFNLNNSGGTAKVQISGAGQGSVNSGTYLTGTNCSSTAGTCGSAAAGSVGITNPATTVTVSTTAVTANSQIFVFEDSTLGTKLTATCNTTLGRTYMVTTRTAGTSFIITASATPAANTACLSYLIIN